MLFLDEPTSGLDSTTSFDLVHALHAVAAKGTNVIAVLHQPSFQLYEMFHKVSSTAAVRVLTWVPLRPGERTEVNVHVFE